MTAEHDVRLGDCVIAETTETCVDGIVIELHEDYTFTLLDFDTEEAIRVNAHAVDWMIYERRNSGLSRIMSS